MKTTRWLATLLVTLSLVTPQVASADPPPEKLKYYSSPDAYCMGACSGKDCCDTPAIA